MDAEPGPVQAPHALLDREREAILAVYDDWHETDRSYRKLAHRGSPEERVHASESTFWRVLALEGPVLPRQRGREPAGEQPGQTGGNICPARCGAFFLVGALVGPG